MGAHGQPACEELGTLDRDGSLNCGSLGAALVWGGTGSGRRPGASEGA